MIFMFALVICLGTPVVEFYSIIFSIMRNPSNHPPGSPIALERLITMIPAMPLVLGFIGALAQSQAGAAPFPFRPTVMFLIAGVTGSVVATYVASRRVVRDGKTERRGGIWAICAVAHFYVAFAAADHIAFFWDENASGILASEVGRPVGIDCGSQFLLIRTDGDALRWRCPHNVVLGNLFNDPFAPWPAYSSGRSTELMVELKKLQSEAQQGTKTE